MLIHERERMAMVLDVASGWLGIAEDELQQAGFARTIGATDHPPGRTFNLCCDTFEEGSLTNGEADVIER